MMKSRTSKDSAVGGARVKLDPGGEILETKSTVFSKVILSRIRQVLSRYKSGGLELQDWDNLYRNDCTCIVLRNVCIPLLVFVLNLRVVV